MNFNSKFVPYIVGGVLLVLVLAGGGYYFYSHNQPKTNSPQAAADEVKRLVEEVGKLIDLPTGETPTVATVSDITKLKDQAFFARAKNGDKVLIYSNAKKAILYDPTAHKVIDVAPINVGSQSAQVSEPKVVLRNGTSTVGLTTKVETDLKKSIPNLNVINKENASRSDYSKSLIWILNDSAKDLGNTLSKTLKADIVSEASGEAKPKDGDIVIILGKDRI